MKNYHKSENQDTVIKRNQKKGRWTSDKDTVKRNNKERESYYLDRYPFLSLLETL